MSAPSVANTIAVALVAILMPALAFAQASITGVVRDASGAVLPGVTVEAASPALIEKVRSTVTNDTGQYRLENLRPGTYAVTFTLQGFSTVKRDAIELQGIVLRDHQRRHAGRRDNGNDYRHRRVADRRRAEHDAAAGAQPRDHRRDSRPAAATRTWRR